MRVLSSSELRKEEKSIRTSFTELGEKAPVLAVGSHRKPEMVIMSLQKYEHLEKLLDAEEQNIIEQLILARAKSLQNNLGEDIEDVAREFGVEL